MKYFLGKISFILVRVKIKHMEVDIIRREQTGNGPSTYTETDSIGKYEIMDGGPIKGEIIPIRLFLKAFQAQPTMKVHFCKYSFKKSELKSISKTNSYIFRKLPNDSQSVIT